VTPSLIEKQTYSTVAFEKSTYKIPEKLEKSNLFIEIKSTNKSCNVTYFSTLLKSQIIENYGQIKITDKADKPLAKVFFSFFWDLNFLARFMSRPLLSKKMGKPYSTRMGTRT